MVARVFSRSWWFLLLHVVVVHVCYMSWWFMFVTCHGGSCFFMVMVLHVFPYHGGSCFFHVMVVHVSQGPLAADLNDFGSFAFIALFGIGWANVF